MDDDTAKAHFLARFGVDVKRIVVAIEAIENGCLRCRLVLKLDIRCLSLWRGEVLGRGALGASPVALTDVEAAANGASVDFTSASVH